MPKPSLPADSENPKRLSDSSSDWLTKAQHRFAMDEMEDSQLRAELHCVPAAEADDELPRVVVTGAKGQDHAMMRVNHPIQVYVEGSLGDYAFALSSQAEFRTRGGAGNGVGEGLSSGAVRVGGDVGDGAGTAIRGGTVAVYGNAGHRCGAAMRAGGIFVRGDVGDECGIGALGGIIVIGGNAGENLGDAMSNVNVFIRGRAKSLAPGVTEAPLRKREELRLGLLLINAGIRGDSKEFRRIIPTAMLEAEEAGRGEITPSWS